MKKVKRTERGWAGHFCAAHRCRFRRNTLLECGKIKIVVSTVGCMESPFSESGFDQIGCDRNYETMAFHSNPKDIRYHDADVTKQISFESEWAIAEIDKDEKADEMHEKVVKEISNKLSHGYKFPIL